MFRRAFGATYRFASTVSKQTSFRTSAGAGVSLGLSFFAAKPEEKLKNNEVENRPKNYDIVIRDCDELYNNYLIDNAYNILKKFSSSNCSELLWRLARVICEKAKLSQDKDERKRLMYEAFEVIKKALDNEPTEGCFGAHKWYGILLDYIGEIEGNKSRLQKSNQVKQHLEKALTIFEGDPTTWHILGLWHYSFADMGYATRMIAKTIFADPPSSTYERALHYFLKAEEIAPDFYSTNQYYIGEVYEKLGKKTEAVEHYKKAFKMAVVTSDDRKAHEMAFKKLKSYGVTPDQLI